MYKLLFFIFAFLAFFIFALNIAKLTTVIGDKRKLFSVQGSDKKYFLFFLMLSLFKPLEVYMQKIKIKAYIVYTERLTKILKIQDYPFSQFTPHTFILFQIFSMLCAMVVTYFLIMPDIIIATSLGILFLVLPYMKISEQHKKITTAIVRQLPDISDLTAVMISSGIDFNNALLKISLLTKGILAKEFSDIISKVSLGIDIKTGLLEMAQKYDIEQLNLFVRTVNSALESGLGMSDALNTISRQLKNEYVSHVEKKAHEAPVKMLVPMTLLILPVIFILLFAPMMISYLRGGSVF